MKECCKEVFKRAIEEILFTIKTNKPTTEQTIVMRLKNESSPLEARAYADGFKFAIEVIWKILEMADEKALFSQHQKIEEIKERILDEMQLLAIDG